MSIQQNKKDIIEKPIKKVGSTIKSYFFTGLVVIAPFAITIYMSYRLLIWVNGMTSKLVPQQWSIGNFVPYAVPGMGLILLILGVVFVGMLTTGFVGKFFVGLWEKIIRKMPIVSSIYSLVKQIFETFLSQKSNSFSQVVLVEYPRKGIWTIGFVCKEETGGEIAEKTGIKTVSVYVPTTPNPTSGFLIFFPENDVIKLKMSVEDGIKYVISCGIVSPEDMEKQE